MDGTHSIDRSFEVTGAVITALYDALRDQKVFLEGTVLKPNMVVSGYDGENKAGADEAADKTLICFKLDVFHYFCQTLIPECAYRP